MSGDPASPAATALPALPRREPGWKKALALGSLAILGAFGACCVLYATAPGVGIAPDSATYIGSARNLLEGRGLKTNNWVAYDWVPLTHFPPLFPALLALGGLFGPDPSVVARWLNALLMGANVVLLGYILYRATRGGAWTAILGSLLFLASADLVSAHTWALSEPLMLFTGFLGLLWLWLYLEDGKPWRLVAASGAMALALLSRYASLPLILTGALGLLLFRPSRPLARLREALVFALMGLGPLALWVWHNWWVSGHSTNRHAVVHWISAKHFKQARTACLEWLHAPPKLPPGRQDLFLYAALGAALLLLALLAWKTFSPNRDAEGRPRPPRLPWLLLVFVSTYLGFLVVSISFFDVATPLDPRILAPVHVALIAFALCVAHEFCASWGWTRWLGLALATAALAWAWPGGVKVRKTLEQVHGTARGYATPAWQKCAFFERIRKMPDVPIYVNNVGAAYYYTGRFVRSVPVRFDNPSTLPNPDLSAQIRRMRDDLLNRGGVFIELRHGGWRANYCNRDELFRTLGLTSIEKTADAEVFTILPPAPPAPAADPVPAAETPP